ncbi:MAG TPA: tRNA preQ1(34) S-adenosylmethionine ribosyltransferase-isomerase QueA [Elainellaceae cyanobacterium]|jgi:S-adenosylmethionine:tRNA ribosyltransferase-isomerase
MNSAQHLDPAPVCRSSDDYQDIANSVDQGHPDWRLSSYDYDLPNDRIAQQPVVPRDRSRLLVVQDLTDHAHHIFRELPNLLQPGDLLVLNNTRVLPARLYGRKPGGTAVELLLLEEHQPNQWLALVKPGRRLKPGAHIQFEMPPFVAAISSNPENTEAASLNAMSGATVLDATVVATDPATKGRIIQFHLPDGTLLQQVLPHIGQVPLPPYITNTQVTSEHYQTVYGDRLGAVAAPTAGLHFTPELLEQLQQANIHHTFVTLHVGVGTFRPVDSEDITAHAMHGEWVDVPKDTVAAIQRTKANGGRIIAVGTTAVRSLEAAAQNGEIRPFCGKTDLFIYPGYTWQVVEGLITNFHLPKSSLLMLVSALIGRTRLLTLYQEAIAHNYRFYSFGDAMLILPSARLLQT